MNATANSTALLAEVQYVDGFSLTNRWLLYTSLMLTPAQFVSGLGNHCPSNLGFLAYNWYTQIVWYKAAREGTLHALSLLPAHFNLIYAVTYMGGVSSGNIPSAILLGLGTAGVMVLNTVTAWIAVTSLQHEGYGVYQFFFFGWRILDDRWHKFFIAWQVFDSLGAFGTVICAVAVAIRAANLDREVEWFWRYPMIPVGAVSILIGAWPLIMWTELIYARNHIQSETDWVSVYLFIVQAGTLLVPSCGTLWDGGSECCGTMAKCLPAALCAALRLSSTRAAAVTEPEGQPASTPASVKDGTVVDEQPKGTENEMMILKGKDSKADGSNEEGVTVADEPVGSNVAQASKKRRSAEPVGDENV